MTSVLPPTTLTSWTESQITAILQATTPIAFDEALENFLAPDAEITVNGKPLSKEQYKALLQKDKLQESSATVDFSGAVEVPTDGEKAGTVGVFFKSTIFKLLRVGGAEESSTLTSSLNVEISQFTPHFITGGGPGPVVFPERRVSKLDQVMVEVANPIILPGDNKPTPL
ncbi:hypothetical protein JAAARDRAFT_171387 [Jaapia argillacea MUCL 33604]|uniref:Uncharacterized protein n=1 Tax=Jaapia argillacea MUCL 33604 TaxID=933084 RepID=A0A067Q9F1_9AGAM|nr:hypothetical protein JAAARDRAFT_171387 [Jaapia argillacea MUCL 33604]